MTLLTRMRTLFGRALPIWLAAAVLLTLAPTVPNLPDAGADGLRPSLRPVDSGVMPKAPEAVPVAAKADDGTEPDPTIATLALATFAAVPIAHPPPLRSAPTPRARNHLSPDPTGPPRR